MDNKIFQAWYRDLTNFIKTTIDDTDSHIVIIALSRKMPRLITWIEEKVLSSEEAKSFRSLIHNPHCIYTTEHAIPFVFSQNNMKEAKVLILDDMIVTGETIQGVSDEIYTLTGHRPSYLSLYAYIKNQKKGTATPSIGTNISEDLPKQLNNIQEARKVMRQFSEKIEETQLPIDMEFPILHIKKRNEIPDNDTLDRIINELRSRQPKARYRIHKIGGQDRDFTQLIEKDINRLFNNDFAKLRLFRHENEARLICYAPNILGDRQVMDPALFTNERYRQLWQDLSVNSIIADPIKDQYDHIITEEDRIRHRLSSRLHKSLVVFANYMFSLSMMIRQKPDYIEALPDNEYKIELRREDLALLIGPQLASRHIDLLNELFQNSITSDSFRQEVNLPDLLATDNVKAEYIFVSTSAIFKSLTVEEAIKKLFAASYSVCSNFNEHNDSSIKGEYVMESFQSLYNKPSMLFQGLEGEMDVNYVIDHLIDEGFIVPVYERVRNENDTHYWRRFFRATHTSPLLMTQ